MTLAILKRWPGRLRVREFSRFSETALDHFEFVGELCRVTGSVGAPLLEVTLLSGSRGLLDKARASFAALLSEAALGVWRAESFQPAPRPDRELPLRGESSPRARLAEALKARSHANTSGV